MTIKSIRDEDFVYWQVRDLDTGKILDNVEYADDEAGLCIVRVRHDSGAPLRTVKMGRIKLEDKRIQEAPVELERMLKWFDFDHLKDGDARGISAPFQALARIIVENVDRGPERTVALRKLLEAKDAAVRAIIHPGG